MFSICSKFFYHNNCRMKTERSKCGITTYCGYSYLVCPRICSSALNINTSKRLLCTFKIKSQMHLELGTLFQAFFYPSKLANATNRSETLFFLPWANERITEIISGLLTVSLKLPPSPTQGKKHPKNANVYYMFAENELGVVLRPHSPTLGWRDVKQHE